MEKKKTESILTVGLKSLFFLVLFIVLSSINLYSTCDQGMAKLCVCVSGMDEPCKIDSKHMWYITVFNCDGTVLEHCGKRYVLMPTKCGCREIALPPGCYYIKAVWSFWVVKPGAIYRVNHFTDAAIVQAVCGKTSCLRLFNPSAHRCGYIYALAVNDLIKQKAIKAETGERAIGAIRAINEQIKPPRNKFELGIEREIDRLLKKKK